MRSYRRLARRAARQHGVVSFGQLRRLGFSRAAVGRMAGAGRLHRVHRGVYAVGHAGLSESGRCLAAVAACGNQALLSHSSAAWLWGFVSVCPAIAEVTVPTRGHMRSGIRLHHSPTLAEEPGTEYERVPVTTVPRTLLDCAATGPTRRLERMIDRAKRVGRLDLVDIDAMLARRRGAPGSRRLTLALDLYRDPIFDRARSERLLLAAIDLAGLPRPAFNLFVAGFEIDAYWKRERFAVEVDGWETHGTRQAFEADRLRQEELKLAGIDSIRIAARRIEREPAVVSDRIRRLLAQRRDALGIDA